MSAGVIHNADGATEMSDRGEPLLESSPARQRSPPPAQPSSPAGSTTRAVMIDLSGTTRSVSQARGTTNDVPQQNSGALDAAREHAGSVINWIVESTSFLRTYLTPEAKVMVVLVGLGCAVYISAAAAVAAHAYLNLRWLTISDDSACNGAAYLEIKTNEVGYNLANVTVACAFVLWIFLRAVRLEKGALLLCGGVIQATLVARSLYFAFHVADESQVRPELAIVCKIAFPIATAIMLASAPVAYKVSRSFGWRHLTKFGADSDGVETMNRYKQLDACAKLDLYITVCAFISLFFFVSDNFLRIYGFIGAAITAAFLLGLNAIVKHRHYWALYAFYFVCLIMPVFYIYTIAKVLMQSGSACMDSPLDTCFDANSLVAFNRTTAAVSNLGPVCSSVSTVASCWASLTCSSLNTTCWPTTQAAFADCCNEYGRCTLKAMFVSTDKPQAVFLAAVGCVVRLLTVYVGYRQAQEMDVPGVQEMIRRGEHNLKNFSLALPTFITARRATVVADDATASTMASPQASSAHFGR